MTFLDQYAGHLAGVATSFLWAVTSLSFAAAARRLGPVAVNAYRIPLALLLLAVTHWWLHGTWTPSLTARQAWLLALSGLIGLSIGDQALFVALVDIGPRLTTLVMTTAPIFAAILGWAALGEALTPLALLGIVLTVGGVAWVVLERPPRGGPPASPHRLRGV
ncbi:MAG: EamA family transporter, partial [Planctomycetota bacterium]